MIGMLAREMQRHIADRTAKPEEMYDALERIEFIAIKSMGFLEGNRLAILNGQG